MLFSFFCITEPSTQVMDTASTSKNKKQYKALFQFDARNTDELSLVPGDVIWVSSHCQQQIVDSVEHFSVKFVINCETCLGNILYINIK